jgi:hypothetical protein
MKLLHVLSIIAVASFTFIFRADIANAFLSGAPVEKLPEVLLVYVAAIALIGFLCVALVGMFVIALRMAQREEYKRRFGDDNESN